MTKTILADQKDRERIDAMARVFTKADRVLSGDQIDVVVDGNALHVPAPSWTDGKTITFNKALIGSVTSIEDIIRLTGLNYHELAHVLYTPRANTSLVKSIRAEGLHQAFNLLEDQRIETFLTAKYPSTIPYLVSTFMRFCIQSERAWDGNFVLVHGRRYIPIDVRREFRNRFKRQDLIPAFEAIIDEYRKLVYPAQFDRGLELTREYNRLLNILHADNTDIEDPHGHTTPGARPDVDSGRPATQREQKEASENADEFDEELEERDREDDEAKAASDDDSDSDDTDVNDGNGEGGDDSEDADADGGSTSDGDLDDQSGSHKGSGDIDGKPSTDAHDGSSDNDPVAGSGGTGASNDPTSSETLKEIFEQIAKQFESNPDVQEDATNKQRAIVNGDGELTVGLDSKRYREVNVYPTDVAVVRRFATILEQLRVDADPGWRRRTSSGRINVQRVINDAPLDEIWDRWEEGNNDAADIECVIAIDVSGSMTYQIDPASRAMWVIKRALESLDANVTVLSYSNESQLVYDKRERASKTQYKQLKANGSTIPRGAIAEAVRVLEASKRSNRILITITDGQWGGEYSRPGFPTSEEMIEALGKRGVTTALAYIGYPGYLESHKCQIAAAVNDPTELVGFAKQIVTQTMKPRKG